MVGPVGTPLHGTISIVPKSSYPFKVTGIRLRRGKNIEAELRSKTGGQGYEVRVVNCRQTTGAYYDTIILTTDSPIQKELMINVYGKIIQKPQRS